MIKFILLSVLTFGISTSSSLSQSQEKIPFRLNNDYNIIVKGLINDLDSVDLMFQIAMREGSLSPIRENKANSVKFDTTEFPEGLSKINKLQVANTKIDSLWIWDNEYTGREADGKIGTLLFKDKIFKIDYDSSRFELYEELPSIEEYIKVPLKIKNGQLFISANSLFDNKDIQGEFLLQSGFSGAILYNNKFSDEYQLSEKLKVIKESKMTNSSGQKLISLICKLPKLDLAGFEFKDMPVGFFVGDIKNQATSYVGADIIHRFNWIIDLKASTAYIQKNKNFIDIYYFNR